MTKPTLKNIMVYDFMRRHAENADTANVKAIYNAHKDEIAQRFGIGGYQTFNWHVRRVIDWKMQTGNDVEVHGLNQDGQANG